MGLVTVSVGAEWSNVLQELAGMVEVYVEGGGISETFWEGGISQNSFQSGQDW